MSHAEFLDWCEYRNRWGTLHLGMRIDRAIARPSSLFANMMSRKSNFSVADFSTYDKQKSSGMPSIQQAFTMISTAAKTNGK